MSSLVYQEAKQFRDCGKCEQPLGLINVAPSLNSDPAQNGVEHSAYPDLDNCYRD